jgi:hypothetical protein
MQNIQRRHLIKLAGIGTVVAAGVGIPAVPLRDREQQDVFRFQAMLGVPEAPLPSYATYVVDGVLNLAAGTGIVASRVLAGQPGAASEIGLPGLGRIINVTGIEEQASRVVVRGVIEDRSQLQPGESHQVEMVIDRARGVVQAPLGGRPVVLTLM